MVCVDLSFHVAICFVRSRDARLAYMFKKIYEDKNFSFWIGLMLCIATNIVKYSCSERDVLYCLVL